MAMTAYVSLLVQDFDLPSLLYS